MFTCRESKGDELSTLVSKMLYQSLRKAVYTTSYKESLIQLDARDTLLSCELNYTKIYYSNSCVL